MFEPGKIWNDTDDVPIQAHGGWVLYDQGVYYWFGENKDRETIDAALIGRQTRLKHHNVDYRAIQHGIM